MAVQNNLSNFLISAAMASGSEVFRSGSASEPLDIDDIVVCKSATQECFPFSARVMDSDTAFEINASSGRPNMLLKI